MWNAFFFISGQDYEYVQTQTTFIVKHILFHIDTSCPARPAPSHPAQPVSSSLPTLTTAFGILINFENLVYGTNESDGVPTRFLSKWDNTYGQIWRFPSFSRLQDKS